MIEKKVVICDVCGHNVDECVGSALELKIKEFGCWDMFGKRRRKLHICGDCKYRLKRIMCGGCEPSMSREMEDICRKIRQLGEDTDAQL